MRSGSICYEAERQFIFSARPTPAAADRTVWRNPAEDEILTGLPGG